MFKRSSDHKSQKQIEIKKRYRVPRLVTLPIRCALALMVFVYIIDQDLWTRGKYLECVTSFLILTIMAGEILFGDIAMAYSHFHSRKVCSMIH